MGLLDLPDLDEGDEKGAYEALYQALKGEKTSRVSLSGRRALKIKTSAIPEPLVELPEDDGCAVLVVLPKELISAMQSEGLSWEECVSEYLIKKGVVWWVSSWGIQEP